MTNRDRLAISCEFLLLLTVAVGCGRPSTDDHRDATGAGGAVIPDSALVAGVMELRHDATSFDRAPQASLDHEPVVVFSGGEDPDFDLTNVWTALVLTDGRVVGADRYFGVHIISFDATGKALKVLARRGQGPGELSRPNELVLGPGDTIIATDPGLNRTSWFTVDGGFDRSADAPAVRAFECHEAAGALSDGRMLSYNRCYGGSNMPRPAPGRMTVPLILSAFTYERADTVAATLGLDLVKVQSTMSGERREIFVPRRFGPVPLALIWDSLLVVAPASHGYSLEVRSLDGALRSVIRVARPRRVVTEAMHQADVKRITDMYELNKDRVHDLAGAITLERETPVADSLAPYVALFQGRAGLLWVVDVRAPLDTTWSATAFRHDGAIMARMTARNTGTPVWFGADRVLVRETDDDGVVRFAMYIMRPRG